MVLQMYGFNAMEVQEAFVKVVEQVRRARCARCGICIFL